jgi:hypothetical protein
MVRDELLKRGVGADLGGEESPGEAYRAPSFSGSMLLAVVVPEEVAEQHRAAIDEVLALVSEPQ